MATASKLSFRARNLDANRPMRVYYADELPDITECTPIARAVTQMPTGMEKEEEMESHLQNAILAQQASTSGASVENHVIPTPKVETVPDYRYEMIYPKQPTPPDKLIKVQAWLSMEREEAEYDLDSEDERYLQDKPHIMARDLEKIIETLEAQSSEVNICQPSTARKVLISHFDDIVIDDVYDYWLAKRKEAATSRMLGCGGLIPRVRTECRKEATAVNPYVAFRRRGEKMQTRRNRKNDEDSYEKVLKLGHDLRRAAHLFEMVKRREKTKLALFDMDSYIVNVRAVLGDYGSGVSKHAAARQGEAMPLKEDNGRTKSKKRRAKASGAMPFQRDLLSKAWLKKNAEVWNESPSAFILGMGASPVVEVEQSLAAAHSANPDGRFQFKRKRGCLYRAPVPDKAKRENRVEGEEVERRFFPACDPSTSFSSASQISSDPEGSRPSMWLRRRIGRGGRVILDRLVSRLSCALPRVPPAHGYVAGRADYKIYDPFALDQLLLEDTAPYKTRRRPRPFGESEMEEDEEELISSRRIYSSSYRSGDEDSSQDAELEAAWLASAPSPPPLPLALSKQPRSPPPKSRRDSLPPENGASHPSPSKRNSPSSLAECFARVQNGLHQSTPPVQNVVFPSGHAACSSALSPPDSTAASPHVLAMAGNGPEGGGVAGAPDEAAAVVRAAAVAVSATSASSWPTALKQPTKEPSVVLSPEMNNIREHVWREASNSPSESNSSADWTTTMPPPAVTLDSGGGRVTSVLSCLSSEEESAARTGEAPPPARSLSSALCAEKKSANGNKPLTSALVGSVSLPLQLPLPSRSPFPFSTASNVA